MKLEKEMIIVDKKQYPSKKDVRSWYNDETIELELERNSTHKCYEFLDEDDSILYDQVKNSLDPKDLIIKKMLRDKAITCRGHFYG